MSCILVLQTWLLFNRMEWGVGAGILSAHNSKDDINIIQSRAVALGVFECPLRSHLQI